MRVIFDEVSCLQAKSANLYVEIAPHDLNNRSRSSIFELIQETPEIHPWYKFGRNANNICKLSYLQVKSANFHVEINFHDLEK